MADVFISYAREDKARADQVARGLQAMGLQCFWDTEIPPGQTWADYIEGKLSACKAVVVLWSANSTGSQWVREEARMGRDKGKLIPALLDGSAAPFGFGEVQAANLSTWTGDPNHPEWQRFSRAVHSAAAPTGAAQPQPQTAWTPPPVGGAQPQAGGESLAPIDYVKKCFRLYADGKGRARRAEYWWYTLAIVVASIAIAVVEMILFGFNSYTSQANNTVLSTVFSLATLAPSISVASRRFHDVGLNGWLVAAFFGAFVIAGGLMAMLNPIGTLIALVAGVGMIVITVLPSKPGANQYGPNPKGE